MGSVVLCLGLLLLLCTQDVLAARSLPGSKDGYVLELKQRRGALNAQQGRPSSSSSGPFTKHTVDSALALLGNGISRRRLLEEENSAAAVQSAAVAAPKAKQPLVGTSFQRIAVGAWAWLTAQLNDGRQWGGAGNHQRWIIIDGVPMETTTPEGPELVYEDGEELERTGKPEGKLSQRALSLRGADLTAEARAKAWERAVSGADKRGKRAPP